MRCGDLTMGLTKAKPFLILKLVDAFRVGGLTRSAFASWRVLELTGSELAGFELAGSELAG
ncbi:hypothetical protein GCM10009433_07030 [Psychroflexus lacisalsi]|uniref:Uncharacterized protein n=1 Tax=Psychroflexus lacisalsi TaxID=503928 RepID=A0ABN1K3W2_9FLAO